MQQFVQDISAPTIRPDHGVGGFGRTAAATAAVRRDQIAGASISDHPFFSALNEPTRLLLQTYGRAQKLGTGETLHVSEDVAFIQEGVIGVFALNQKVCVGVAGNGALLGLEGAVCTPMPTHMVALAESRVFEAPSRLLLEGLGRSKVTELCMRQALTRLHATQAEAACNATHLVPQRLAKWLLRLHRANRGRDICLTQAELAQIIGVQRTSINAAARQIQGVGAARFIRGRVLVQDHAKLARAACGCAL